MSNVYLILLCFLSMVLTGFSGESKDKLEDKFPEWSFCVAYNFRDADERDARPNDVGHPSADGDNWIPGGGLLQEGHVVDVAALASRTTSQSTLSKEIGKRVVSATLSGKAKHPVMDCYDPHHIFVFYNPIGKPVASIEVCLTCNSVKMVPNMRGNGYSYETADLIALAKILSDAGVSLKPFKSFEDYKRRTEEIQKRSK